MVWDWTYNLLVLFLKLIWCFHLHLLHVSYMQFQTSFYSNFFPILHYPFIVLHVQTELMAVSIGKLSGKFYFHIHYTCNVHLQKTMKTSWTFIRRNVSSIKLLWVCAPSLPVIIIKQFFTIIWSICTWKIMIMLCK